MDKIKQIIPAEGWSARYDKSKAGSFFKYRNREVTCWAIVEDEDADEVQIRGYGTDGDGSLVDLGSTLYFRDFCRTEKADHSGGACRLLEYIPCHGNWFVITKNRCQDGKKFRYPVAVWAKYEDQNEDNGQEGTDSIHCVIGMTMSEGGLGRIDHAGHDIIGYERDGCFIDVLEVDEKSGEEKWGPFIKSLNDLES